VSEAVALPILADAAVVCCPAVSINLGSSVLADGVGTGRCCSLLVCLWFACAWHSAVLVWIACLLGDHDHTATCR
jgi:hypothetical protein